MGILSNLFGKPDRQVTVLCKAAVMDIQETPESIVFSFLMLEDNQNGEFKGFHFNHPFGHNDHYLLHRMMQACGLSRSDHYTGCKNKILGCQVDVRVIQNGRVAFGILDQFFPSPEVLDSSQFANFFDEGRATA